MAAVESRQWIWVNIEYAAAEPVHVTTATGLSDQQHRLAQLIPRRIFAFANDANPRQQIALAIAAEYAHMFYLL